MQTPTKKKQRASAVKALVVTFAWKGERTTKKTECTSQYTERLGTISPTQLTGEIAKLYRAYWHVLAPGTFREVTGQKTNKARIERKVVILIPCQVVKNYRAKDRPATIEKAVQKAIRTLYKFSQPINYHTVNGLLALYGMETSRQYIHSTLTAMKFQKVFSVAKVPYWTPKNAIRGVPA